MKLHDTHKYTRPLASAAIVASMLAGTMMSAAPAMAKPVPLTSTASTDTINGLSRQQVLDRARTWTDSKVPYSQTAWKDGYRTDCSGFVSMAYNLDQNLVTWLVPTAAKEITKDELRPGDVLLNETKNRHVVMFAGWNDKAKTEYRVLEQTGQSGVDRAIERDMNWPYRIDGELYKPYRFTNIEGYYKAVPKGDRQPVTGFVKAEPIAPKPTTDAAEKPKAKSADTAASPKAAAEPKTAPKRDAASRTADSRTEDARKTRAAERTQARNNADVADVGLLKRVVSWVNTL